MQKLLYYAQGWHLAWFGRPLFSERIESWEMGPVVASFWADDEHDRPRPQPTALSDEAVAVVEYVVERYGQRTGNQLRDMSHRESPWRDAYGADAGLARSHAEISPESMISFFRTDSAFLAHGEEVDRLAAIVGHPFGEPMTAGLESAISQALS